MPEAATQAARVVDVLGPGDPGAIGPYRLLGRLGRGGMGRVYLGQSPSGRLVAIKVIREELADDEMFQRRFARELAAARAVSPLFTAAVVAAEPDAHPPWFATTYIDGPSLARHVGAAGPMRPDAVLTLAAGLAEALSSMHGVGLVHRDLKPSNVLLSTAGPHVIDFGIALPAGATRLTSSMVVGTPAYVAPERLDGDEDSTAGDIFSLGSTIYFASTARSLLGSGTMEVQLARLARAKFDLGGVSRTLRPIVARCLSRSPKDRPTAVELMRLLVASGAQPAAEDWYTRPVAARHNAFEPSRRARDGDGHSPARTSKTHSHNASGAPPSVDATRNRPVLEPGPLPASAPPAETSAARLPPIVAAAATWLAPRRRLVAYGTLAVATVAGMGWVLRGENQRRPPVGPRVDPADVRWRYEATGPITPLVVNGDGGDLVVEAAPNEVRATIAGTDRVAWSRPADDPQVLGSGWPRTVIVAERGRYSAVGATDGLQRFEVAAASRGAATVVTSAALVLVGQRDFIAVNQTGGRLTAVEAGSDLAGFTAIGASANLIFVGRGLDSPSVTAIDLRGSRLWTWSSTAAIKAAGGVDAPGPIRTLLADRVQVFVVAQRSLTALDRSGKPQWATPAGATAVYRPANRLDRSEMASAEALDVVLVEENHRLSARVGSTGDLLWQQFTGADPSAVGLNPSGDTCVVCRAGFVDLLAADTGRTIRRIQLPEDARRLVPSGVTITADAAYLSFRRDNGDHGELYAIGLL